MLKEEDELELIMYNTLVSKGELTIDDMCDIECLKPNYGLRMVSFRAITKLESRPNVKRIKDKDGWMFIITGEDEY